jgi:hypothetical protein
VTTSRPGTPNARGRTASDIGSPKFDPTKPHPARRYDYWLGGKDNFAADRESAELIAKVFPQARTGARENRKFMRRAATRLAREGIRQFLDIGTGIPTSPNLHEVVQGIDPACRIVCVDNDDLVMVHDRALLVSSPEGAVKYIHEDLRDPHAILQDPLLRATLNFAEPIALVLIAVLHFLTDDDNPYGCVARLIEALPAGSVIVLSHVDESAARFNSDSAESSHGKFRARTASEIARFIEPLEPDEPGLVSIVDWYPGDEPKPEASASDTCMYGVIARKR